MDPRRSEEDSLVAGVREDEEGSEEIEFEEQQEEAEESEEEEDNQDNESEDQDEVEEDNDDDTMTDTQARWLGGFNPKEEARTAAEATSKLSGISKTKRKDLTPKDLNNLKAKAEEGMKEQFKLMEPLADGSKASKDQLKAIYSVTLRVEEFRRSLQAFDLDDVFTIPDEFEKQSNEEMWPKSSAKAINLFLSSQDVTLDTVKHALAFMMKRGQEFHVENLLWSGAKLLNSCDDKLRQKIEEQTLGWPVEYATGPVYFKVMIHLIMASSAQSLRGVTQQLEKMTLKDFDGENVAEYVSFARGAIEQLRNNNALPIDTLTILTDALKDSSTKWFNDFVTSMYNNHVQGVKKITAEDLLRAAEEEYIMLTSGLKWESGLDAKSQQSVFFTGRCNNCGTPGHKAAQCRRGQQQGRGGGRVNARGGNAGRFQGRGRGGRGGRGMPGRGRGGRGRFQGGRQGGILYDREAPRPGEPKTRTKNGREEKWCARCGYWTWNPGAHHADSCTRAPRNNNESGNVVREGQQTPTTTTTDQDNQEDNRERRVRFRDPIDNTGSGQYVSQVQDFV